MARDSPRIVDATVVFRQLTGDWFKARRPKMVRASCPESCATVWADGIRFALSMRVCRAARWVRPI